MRQCRGCAAPGVNGYCFDCVQAKRQGVEVETIAPPELREAPRPPDEPTGLLVPLEDREGLKPIRKVRPKRPPPPLLATDGTFRTKRYRGLRPAYVATMPSGIGWIQWCVDTVPHRMTEAQLRKFALILSANRVAQKQDG